MRKIALYCRVSSVRQEKEHTIQTQIFKLKEIYKKSEIVKEYLDENYSGTEIDRPALNRLREDAKSGLFNVVALYSFDRLSRKVGHQLVIKKELIKNDVQIEVLGKKLEDTPEGEFGETVLGVISQLEQEKILQRMKDGKLAKVKAGKLIASYPTYGYDYIKKTLNRDAYYKINLKEAKIVKLIFKLYLETQNIQEVVRRLKGLSIKTRGRRSEPKDFCAGTIKYMLKNEVYIGNYYFRKHKAVEPKRPFKKKRKYKYSSRVIRPKSECILVKVPDIISKRDFNKIQEIREKMKREFTKKAKFFYMCQGLIICIHCGYRYYAQPHRTFNTTREDYKYSAGYPSYASYCCRGKRKSENKRSNKKCPSRYMSVPKLDNYVWTYVDSLVRNASKIKKVVRLLKKSRDEDKKFNQDVYDSLLIGKMEVENKKQKFLDLYGDNIISKDDLKEKIKSLNDQVNGMNIQIKEAEKEFSKIKNPNAIEKGIEQLCLEYKKKIKNPSNELKKHIVQKWVREINILDNGNIRIKIRLPRPESKQKIMKLASHCSSL